MQYTDFKGISLSLLGFGAMRLPGTWTNIKYGEAKEMLDYAFSKGVNYYDTAYIYNNGKSEEFLGQALEEYDRNSYYLADKFNLQANPDYRAQFAEQLKRLRTDYIDFYLLHGLNDAAADDYLNCGALEYFCSLKESGQIKYLGVSIHCSPATFERIIDAYDWDFVQIQLNYYDWLYGDAKVLCDLAEKNNIPVIVMEPVRGGLLANLTPEGVELLKKSEPNRSVASWALRWAAGLPGIAVVLSGMSNMEQLKDNIDTYEPFVPLTAEQNELAYEAARLLRPTVSVACTSCRYCCEDCPQKLDIPLFLSVYNDIKIGGNWRASFLEHLPDDKRPSACTACGECVKHCPQGFEIPSYIAELKKFI